MYQKLLKLLGFEVTGNTFTKYNIQVIFKENTAIVTQTFEYGQIAEIHTEAFKCDQNDYSIYGTYDFSPFELYCGKIMSFLMRVKGINDFDLTQTYKAIQFLLFEAGYLDNLDYIDDIFEYVNHVNHEVPYTKELVGGNYWPFYEGRMYHEEYWYVLKNGKKFNPFKMFWWIELLEALAE